MRKEQFDEWHSHPATIEIFKELEDVREDLKEDLARGATLGSEVQTARLVGNIEGLNQLLNIKYEGDADDEKQYEE